MDLQKEREAFEAFFYENCLSQWEQDMSEMLFQELENGEYDHARVQSSWLSWQAAKTQAVQEWISVKDQLPISDPYNREYWVYETLNNKVQHDYWVCPDSDLGQDFEPFFNNWYNNVTHWMPMGKYPKPPVLAQEPAND